MTVRREHGRKGPFEMVCDAPACDSTMGNGRFDFHVTLREAKAAGWAIFQSGGTWLHNCPLHRVATNEGDE